MPLGDFPVRAQVGVVDIDRAVEFYEGKLGLRALRSTPSAQIENGGRIYACDGVPALVVYQTPAAAGSKATLATWYVDDIVKIVNELADSGIDFLRYDGLEHDSAGVTVRAGGGHIAWFQDPDGNTFAVESDA